MFRIHSTDDGRVPAWEYLPAGAIAPKVGTALYLSSGVLAVATGTTKPEFISMIECDSALTTGDIIPVIRAASDIVFETISSEAMTSRKIGESVTVDSTGGKVTATTSSGVAKIVEIVDSAAGGKVRVRF